MLRTTDKCLYVIAPHSDPVADMLWDDLMTPPERELVDD